MRPDRGAPRLPPLAHWDEQFHGKKSGVRPTRQPKPIGTWAAVTGDSLRTSNFILFDQPQLRNIGRLFDAGITQPQSSPCGVSTALGHVGGGKV
jgi:hypothetical protein